MVGWGGLGCEKKALKEKKEEGEGPSSLCGRESCQIFPEVRECAPGPSLGWGAELSHFFSFPCTLQCVSAEAASPQLKLDHKRIIR